MSLRRSIALVLALGLVETPAWARDTMHCRRFCRLAVRRCIQAGMRRRRCKRELMRQCRRTGRAACDLAFLPTTTVTTSTTTTITLPAMPAATWRSVGLPGGTVARRVLVDAGTPERVFTDQAVSVDGGATWTEMAPPPVGLYFLDMALDPSGTGTIWATTSDNKCRGALVKSVDAGTTWTIVLSSNPPCTMETFLPFPFPAVAIDPQAPGTIYVAGAGRTTDGGATWSADGLAQGLIDEASAIVVDPADSSTLYEIARAQQYGYGALAQLYRSTDTGETFSPIGPVNESFTTVVADPSTVFAGTASGHVYRSSDRGEHWTPDGGGLPAYAISALAIDAGRPGTIYASLVPDPALLVAGGLYRSVDGGVTWEPTDSDLPHVPGVNFTDVAVDPGTPGTLYVAVGWLGVFRSDSGGARWTNALRGNGAGTVSVAAVDPFAPQTLYVYDETSRDGGASWSRPPNAPWRAPTAIFPDPVTSGTIYWLGWPGPNGPSLFKTTDGGEQWVESEFGFSNPRPPSGFAVDPTMPDTVYVCQPGTLTSDGSGPLVLTDSGVQRSIDGGASWGPIVPLPIGCSGLVIDPTNPLTLYAATWHGVLKSITSGASWTTILGGDDSDWYSLLTMDPRNPQRLYVLSNTGPLATADGGVSWSPTAPLPDGTFLKRVAVSPITSVVYVVATALEAPDRVLAGPVGATSWTDVSDGLAVSDIWSLLVSSDGRTLYAAGGVSDGLMARQIMLCATDVDCDDHNPCTVDTCEVLTGVCGNTALTDGAPCDDGDPCTLDTCVYGACRSLYLDRDGDGICDLATPAR